MSNSELHNQDSDDFLERNPCLEEEKVDCFERLEQALKHSEQLIEKAEKIMRLIEKENTANRKK